MDWGLALRSMVPDLVDQLRPFVVRTRAPESATPSPVWVLDHGSVPVEVRGNHRSRHTIDADGHGVPVVVVCPWLRFPGWLTRAARPPPRPANVTPGRVGSVSGPGYARAPPSRALRPPESPWTPPLSRSPG